MDYEKFEEELDYAIADSVAYLHSIITKSGWAPLKIAATFIIAQFARIFLAEISDDEGSDTSKIFR